MSKGERERQSGVQCDWLAGTVLYLHFSLGLGGILITLLQYRFSSLTFSLAFSCTEPTHSYFSRYCPHLPINLINSQSYSFPLFIHFYWRSVFVSHCCNFTREDIREPPKHSPAQILCLPEDHSSHPWQPASLFTYPVCRQSIAMTTSWLLCQFSDAIVLSL